MKYIEAGGARISAIGLGTWQFGSREWGYGTDYAEGEAGRILTRALDLGVNLVDTAEIYAFGRSERIVGKAIADRRGDVFLATKIMPVLPLPPIVEQRGRASARRLGVEQIDLYQLHWPNPAVPLGTTMEGMRRLRDAGVVRHVGVSNYSAGRWRAAERALGSPVLSNQVRFSLVSRAPEREILPYAAEAGRVVIAYSPLGQGLLSGRYDADHLPAGAARRSNSLFLPENLERARPLIDAVREVAAAHDATPTQVALAWVIRRPNVVAIPGASSVAQVEANVAAADLELTEDEDERLTEASAAFHPVTGPAAVPRMLATRLRR